MGRIISLEEAKEEFDKEVRSLQNAITEMIVEFDSDVEITEDLWNREDAVGEDGGGGITRHFRGKVFESGGVNTSRVYGQLKSDFAEQLGSERTNFWASGISLILHPSNPRVPTVHANFRMIHLGDKYWFGGGADLTPFYPHEEDFIHFHKHWAKVCQPFDTYGWMKQECDKYFVNHHRNGEMRGIGGLFFDRFKGQDLESELAMMRDLGNGFIPSYFPIVEKRVNEEFDELDVDFQLHRRGRYVEFNLLHDRGTLFGLKTGGRIDSILISLPPRVCYTYAYKPKKGGVHELMKDYYRPIDWLNFKSR